MFEGVGNFFKCPFCSKQLELELRDSHLKDCSVNANPGEVLLYLQKSRQYATTSSSARVDSLSRNSSAQSSCGVAQSSGIRQVPSGRESFLVAMQQGRLLDPSVPDSGSRRKEHAGDSKHPTGVIQDVTNMFVEQQDCDIIISCKNSASILCHKFMLQARCPTLLRKLYSSFSSESKNIINLKSFSVEVVRAFLFLVYSGDIHVKLRRRAFAELEALCTLYKLQLPKKAPTSASKSDATRSAGPRAFPGLTGYSPGCAGDLYDSSSDSSDTDTSDDARGPKRAKIIVAKQTSSTDLAASNPGRVVGGTTTQKKPQATQVGARKCGVSNTAAKEKNVDKTATEFGSSGDSLLSDLPEALVNNP